MRTAANQILGWKIGISEVGPSPGTLEALAHQADAVGVDFILGSGEQKLGRQVPKPIDVRLQPGERLFLTNVLLAKNIRMPAFRLGAFPSGAAETRTAFQLAKDAGVEILIVDRLPPDLASIDSLATEYGISVAVAGSPKATLQAIGTFTRKIGIFGSTASWLKEGLPVVPTLEAVKDRLLVLQVDEPTGAQPDWSGVKTMLLALYRTETKPALMTVVPNPERNAPDALMRALRGFESALQPVLAMKVEQLAKTAAIRGPERLDAQTRQDIDAALPKAVPAQPRKPRKLLVLDVNIAYGGHASIPAANYGLEQMGKRTGAYEAVFSNDLNNLRYPQIRQYDAVFLNNTVGMIFVDPAVREGLTRFVREGGGLGGNHGVSHASMDWDGFSDMIGVKRGVHRERTERAWIKIDDPGSPLTVPFAGQGFIHEDEFFRFVNPPYSRDKLHVLLSLDVVRTDMNQGRTCASPCVRDDADYAVSWIRNYGQGRVFFAVLGHNPTIFTNPALAEYFLRGVQYILGDLDADARPSRP